MSSNYRPPQPSDRADLITIDRRAARVGSYPANAWLLKKGIKEEM